MYLTTGQDSYRDLALECASWLDCQNHANALLYSPRAWLLFRRAERPQLVNADTGAESAIEAGFLELTRRPLRSDLPLSLLVAE